MKIISVLIFHFILCSTSYAATVYNYDKIDNYEQYGLTIKYNIQINVDETTLSIISQKISKTELIFDNKEITKSKKVYLTNIDLAGQNLSIQDNKKTITLNEKLSEKFIEKTKKDKILIQYGSPPNFVYIPYKSIDWNELRSDSLINSARNSNYILKTSNIFERILQSVSKETKFTDEKFLKDLTKNLSLEDIFKATVKAIQELDNFPILYEKTIYDFILGHRAIQAIASYYSISEINNFIENLPVLIKFIGDDEDIYEALNNKIHSQYMMYQTMWLLQLNKSSNHDLLFEKIYAFPDSKPNLYIRNAEDLSLPHKKSSRIASSELSVQILEHIMNLRKFQIGPLETSMLEIAYSNIVHQLDQQDRKTLYRLTKIIIDNHNGPEKGLKIKKPKGRVSLKSLDKEVLEKFIKLDDSSKEYQDILENLKSIKYIHPKSNKLTVLEGRCQSLFNKIFR